MNRSVAENLATAFETFNETTQRLKEAYDKLQERIAQLNSELEDKNRQLTLKIEELNRTKGYLNDILEAMTDGVVAIDVNGRITTVNKAALRITGYSAHEIENRSYREVFGDGFGSLPRAASRSSFPKGHMVAELSTKHGARIPVSESVALLTDRRGSVTGAVKVFRDLSEVTELREQVRQKDRLAAVGQMAATVAHEIRNPLGGIEGFAALLARDIPDDDPRKRLVENIIAGTKSLNRIVSELLAFTRPMTLKIEEIDCEGLVRSALALASDAGNGVTVRMRTEPAGSRVRMHGDTELLRQALLNIALNGFQSMPNGGTLRIRICTEPKGDKDPKATRIAFTDEGCGIPEKVLPRIFEPFFTTKEKGTGLGLSVAARIIETHGGRITVRSKEGVGSTFEVHVPYRVHHANSAGGDVNGS